jgi:hypothetical protein
VLTNADVLLLGYSWILRDKEGGEDKNCVIRPLVACIFEHRLNGLKRLRWLEHVVCTTFCSGKHTERIIM